MIDDWKLQDKNMHIISSQNPCHVHYLQAIYNTWTNAIKSHINKLNKSLSVQHYEVFTLY